MTVGFRSRKIAGIMRAWHRIGTPRTCLDCGFLALDDKELGQGGRTLLWVHLGGSSLGLPRWEDIQCAKGLWVGYEIHYVGPAFEALERELRSSRRRCRGWFTYRPGHSPQQHLDFQTEGWRMWANRGTVAIGAAVGGVAGGLMSWLLHFFQ